MSNRPFPATHKNFDEYSSYEPSSTSYSYNGRLMLAALVCLFVVVAFVFMLHVYARWFLSRSTGFRWVFQRRGVSLSQHDHPHHIVVAEDPSIMSATGLDASIISSLPVFVYKSDSNKDEDLECAVCLSLFEKDDKGRLLPMCHHAFHVTCIDSWLQSRSTCPICRASAGPGFLDGPGPLVPEQQVGETEIGGDAVSSFADTIYADGATVLDSAEETTVVNGSCSCSQLEVSIEIENPTLVSGGESPTACPSMSSLRRMLNRNRSERKVFPSTQTNEDTQTE